ncbi:MAG: hypothetical protein K0R38_1243 [Polyangiaceae bacterium]|nr:hypothetical protein [Polyangiaceae bacterium]
MACQIVTTRGAVFVVWGRPSPADMNEVLAAVEAAAASCGHPVLYVTRVPVSAPPPDASARARLDEVMPSLVKACSTYHVVLEGEGFSAAVKRGILTGLFQLSWRRKTFFVHADSAEVGSALAEHCRATVQRLLTAAERRGLLSATPFDAT